MKALPHGLPKVRENRGVSMDDTSAGIVSAAMRLLKAMADKREARLPSPILVKEILMRLLLGPIGTHVAQLGQAESSVERVAQAIEWVRAHYDEPLSVEALAEMVHRAVAVAYSSAMNERIVIDPDICNGRPTVRGTRITAQTVIEFLAAGDSIEDVLDEYPTLTREDVLACLAFSSHLLGHQFAVEKTA